MEAPKIMKTRDYSIFKFVNFNRDKHQGHINNIKSILQRENLLHLHPILVNNDMEVVDGQHRLEAAKELGLEIFYIKSELSYDHILNSNLYQRKLGLKDVLNFYAKKDKNKNYVEIMNFLKLLNISAKGLFGLIIGLDHKKTNEMIRDGLFELPENKTDLNMLIDYFSRFLNYCKEKRITPIAMFGSSNCTRALRELFLYPEFDFELFLKKLDMKWFELKPQVKKSGWFRLFVKIYNHLNRDPIPLNLTDNENDS
jgi:hypothetical protein